MTDRQTLLAGLAIGSFALMGAMDSNAASSFTLVRLQGVGYGSEATEFLQLQASPTNFSTYPSRAMRDNATDVARLRASLQRQGVEVRDIRTTSMQFSEGRDPRSDASERPRGFNVEHGLSIFVRDPAKAGAVMDALVEAGAKDIRVANGYGYSANPSEAELKAARQGAIRDAMQKAQTYADAMGLKIRRAVEINDQSSYSVNQPLPAARIAAESATQIDAPPTRFMYSVGATFELERR